jgi:hypothetical protein
MKTNSEQPTHWTKLVHDKDIHGRILDYMDELDTMTEDISPSVVRHRLRMILERAGDAAFEQYINLPILTEDRACHIP